MAASNPLIGTWRLISWENKSVEDGQISYPLGKDAAGYIMYNQDGYMFVAIMSPYRLKFAGGDLLSGTPEEEVQCYCRHVVRGETDDELVANVQKHAREDHDMEVTREQVLAMAQQE